MKITEANTGTAAGVPFVAIPPRGDRAGAAVVVAWHSMALPTSARSMAAALPLDGLNAWRIYLGLPPHQGRPAATAHCAAELMANVLGPAVEGAAEKFPAVLADLLPRLPVGDAPLGLLGGGLGAAVAQLVLAEADIPVRAAALVSPVVQLRGAVHGAVGCVEVTCSWAESSRRIADRLDFIARVDTIIKRHPRPDIMFVTGTDDDPTTRENVEQLWYLISTHDGPAERASLVTVPNLRRALANDSGAEPAQHPTVDAALTDWFRRHLHPDSWRKS